jgi:SAM-dependent methyltransferase
MLLLSVTNHITENVAPVPLLWILPLSVYLLSFILAFGARGPLNRAIWLRLLAFALGILGYSIYDVNSVESVQVSLPVFLVGLFICCMYCHGELNRLRPRSEDLPSMYLAIAFGGAVGAIFVGLIAPRIFSGIYELPIALAATAAVATALNWDASRWALRVLWIAVTGCMIVVVYATVGGYRENTLSMRRSFYGSLRVTESRYPGLQQKRTLFHGTIQHGSQFMSPLLRLRPTTYYGPESGIGIVLREGYPGPKRVGIVGLGTGTLAAYGRAGDDFRFYEINSQVTEIARSLFTYLRESPAKIEVVPGDARLSLERETGSPFDVIALDAFSGDAIPVHLLTEQALEIYRRHLNPDGVLAFHISNDFLDLAPVVQQLAIRDGLSAVLVKSHEDLDSGIFAADWVLVTNNGAIRNNPAVKIHAAPIAAHPGLRPWTDAYNNLLRILKTPQIR